MRYPGSDLLLAVCLLPAALAIPAGCTQKVEPPPANIKESPAPDFTLPNLDGASVHSSSFKGKIVVVCFWTAWSPGSARQIPNLIDLQKEWGGQNVQVVGIALEDHASDVKAYAADTSFNFPVLIAPPDFHETFGGIDAIPSIFIIDPQGNLINHFTGLTPQKVLEEEIRWLKQQQQQSASKEG